MTREKPRIGTTRSRISDDLEGTPQDAERQARRPREAMALPEEGTAEPGLAARHVDARDARDRRASSKPASKDAEGEVGSTAGALGREGPGGAYGPKGELRAEPEEEAEPTDKGPFPREER